jgi:ribulose kinase
LTVTDRDGKPVSVSRTGETEEDEKDENLGKDGEWNIILWADHRAEEEAEIINATGEGVLGFVGKTMSVSKSRARVEGMLMYSSRWRFPKPFGSKST